MQLTVQPVSTFQGPTTDSQHPHRLSYDLMEHITAEECEKVVTAAQTIYGRILSDKEVWKLIAYADDARYRAQGLEKVLKGEAVLIGWQDVNSRETPLLFDFFNLDEQADAMRLAGANDAINALRA